MERQGKNAVVGIFATVLGCIVIEEIVQPKPREWMLIYALLGVALVQLWFDRKLSKHQLESRIWFCGSILGLWFSMLGLSHTASNGQLLRRDVDIAISAYGILVVGWWIGMWWLTRKQSTSKPAAKIYHQVLHDHTRPPYHLPQKHPRRPHLGPTNNQH